ncbi:hypothetical protein G0U57_016160 [Chelydra serpentina]|uniref:Protein kinase domain-containing protein n=1 Tax=Chelydra serpentina TaxID=8475 RepID=A0A8T1RVN1_CHESE|nr:hypothetical protein G0U57_016160 [Chelydra serpentina]
MLPSSCLAVSLLKNLKHANIVTLHDFIHTERSLTLVFEYLDSDLKQYLDNCGNLMNMHNVKSILFQLLRGLAYCHKARSGSNLQTAEPAPKRTGPFHLISRSSQSQINPYENIF